MNVHRTVFALYLVNWQCERICCNWLRDGTAPNEPNRNPAGDHRSIFEDLDFLQILTVNAFADASRLASVTAQILSLAAFNFLVASARFQVSVQLELSCTLDALIFLQGTHVQNSF